MFTVTPKFTLRTAVAQRIERGDDYAGGREFESRQRYSHKMALGLVTKGHFACNPNVSPQRYIGYMKQIPGSDDKALFVEVPTPVNAMSAEEKRDFAEEILRALEGKK